MKKTNAMRLLDLEKIEYNIYTYDIKDGKKDGISVAGKIGKEPEDLYKTLIIEGEEEYGVLIPCDKEMDLKKFANFIGEKKVHLLHPDKVFELTGYEIGGCSPVGIRKQIKMYIDESINNKENIVVSGGKIGCQIELKSKELIKLLNMEIGDFT